jgi:hypothetical protein
VKARLFVALVAILVSFVALANLAVFWHGALFIALTLPWGVTSVRLFDWARAPRA